jgi:hypothetical protein
VSNISAIPWREHVIFLLGDDGVHFVLEARVAQWVRSLDLTAHTSLSQIRRGFAPSFVNYKKGCTRLTAASDKVYQLLAQGRWFSPGTPASSTTKTGRHDIAEILLKVALNTKIQIQIHFVLDLHALFDFYSTFVLAHWNNSPQVEMSPHSEYNPNSEPTSICYYSLMLIG